MDSSSLTGWQRVALAHGARLYHKPRAARPQKLNHAQPNGFHMGSIKKRSSLDLTLKASSSAFLGSGRPSCVESWALLLAGKKILCKLKQGLPLRMASMSFTETFVDFDKPDGPLLMVKIGSLDTVPSYRSKAVASGKELLGLYIIPCNDSGAVLLKVHLGHFRPAHLSVFMCFPSFSQCLAAQVTS